MTKRITGGRYLAEMLKIHDVSHVFYMDAVLRAALVEMDELGVRYVLAHSEKGAAYMADGYARAARRPGFCFAQSVGAANLAAGLQDAYLAQTPVIAITGRQIQRNQYRNAYQEVPHQPLFQSVTNFSGVADQVDQYSHVFRTAWRSAMASMAPAHLDLGGHTADLTAIQEDEFDVIRDERMCRIPAFRPGASAMEIDELARAIDRAERPVFVLGIGAVHSDAGSALTSLVDRIGAGVVSSLDGKNVLFERHELNGGIAGSYSSESANRIMAEADLVILAGSEAGDQVTYNFQLVAADAAVFQIDPNPVELGRNFPRARYLQSDVARCFEDLATRVKENRREAWRAFISSAVRAWKEKAAAAKSSNSVPMRPERLCLELERLLPSDAILVADTGFSSQWSGTLVDFNSPNQRYIRAAGSLGWGFPAAIGAKAAAPERPVVCFTGDAGFMYHLPELETARRHGFHTITVINNNLAVAQGLENIKAIFKGRGKPSNAYVYVSVDFAAVAQAFGCFGARVHTPEQFPDAFHAAVAANLPAVIDVLTDVDAQPIPAWSPPR